MADHSFPPWTQQEVTSRGRGLGFREEKTKVDPIWSKNYVSNLIEGACVLCFSISQS